MELSGRFRVRRTYILVILRRIGPLFNIVALQLSNLVQNEDHDDALKWRSHLSWTLARQAYLAIWRWCKRFHTNWINQNDTSFTNITTDQKLAKILEDKWLDETCPKWVEVGYMDNRRPRKIGSHNGARENKLASQTEILDRIKELKMSSHGGMTWAQLWWRAMIRRYEGPCKFQLIWILLASTSFTKPSVWQKLWKFTEEDWLGK